MKRLLLSLLLLSAPVWSEHPAHDKLRALRADMEKSMNALDVDGLLKHVTDDVVFTTMNGDTVRGKQGIREYYERMMTGPNKRVAALKTHFEADDLTVLYGEDTGIAFGHSEDDYKLTDGSEFHVRPRWSACMVRQNGEWKIANFHYSTNMFENPVTETLLKKTGMVAAAAAAGALVVGLGIGFWLGKRRA